MQPIDWTTGYRRFQNSKGELCHLRVGACGDNPMYKGPCRSAMHRSLHFREGRTCKNLYVRALRILVEVLDSLVSALDTLATRGESSYSTESSALGTLARALTTLDTLAGHSKGVSRALVRLPRALASLQTLDNALETLVNLCARTREWWEFWLPSFWRWD